MKTLKTSDKNFENQWAKILFPQSSLTPTPVEDTVRSVLKDIAQNGDRALRDYTKKFDQHAASPLEVSAKEIKKAIKENKWENSNLLMMSSGNFDGISFEKLADELI